MLPSKFETLTQASHKAKVLVRQMPFETGADMIALLRREEDSGLASYDLYTAKVDTNGGAFITHCYGVDKAAEFAGIVVPGMDADTWANVWVRHGEYCATVTLGRVTIESVGIIRSF